MTKREMANLRRLELENSELRDQVKRHIEVYRDQAIELIELRAAAINQFALGAMMFLGMAGVIGYAFAGLLGLI